MKETAILAVFVTGFTAFVSALTYLGMDFAFNRMNKNNATVPIIVHCPDNTKQIVIPDAKKLEL